ncbi:PP2C family protein-serine/threonine phosphatase [Actinoplanes sp. NPDC051343]|uniref:PP2C family protein-serine/threonine phosphatase n=1 Tax=Actinoplanes sp. NPDC051343 TaxID=3363906 RepID=UPI0037B3C807
MTITDCASCADERAAGAAFCEACGNKLNEADTEAEAEAEIPSAAASGIPDAAADGAKDPKACPHCGTAGSVGADGYCENCGMLAARPRDHIEIELDAAAAVTDRGQRHHRNEDAMWLAGSAGHIDAVVSDGVSASFDPDVASQTAADTAGAVLAGTAPGGTVAAGAESSEADRLADAIRAAGAAVAELAGSGDPRRAASNPACTIVAATVRNQLVDVGWVGDSRAYWLPAEGPAEQLTEDDSWATHAIALGADPQMALRDPKAHAITAWLGADAGPVRPRTAGFTVTAPGHLVLCSDGLWNYLPDPARFADTVRDALDGTSLLGAARQLADFANAAGGADNITVVLIPVAPADTEIKE